MQQQKQKFNDCSQVIYKYVQQTNMKVHLSYLQQQMKSYTQIEKTTEIVKISEMPDSKTSHWVSQCTVPHTNKKWALYITNRIVNNVKITLWIDAVYRTWIHITRSQNSLHDSDKTCTILVENFSHKWIQTEVEVQLLVKFAKWETNYALYSVCEYQAHNYEDNLWVLP